MIWATSLSFLSLDTKEPEESMLHFLLQRKTTKKMYRGNLPVTLAW